MQAQIQNLSPKTLNNIIDTIEEKSGKSSALSFQKLCSELSENSRISNPFAISKKPDQILQHFPVNRSTPEKELLFPFRTIPRTIPPNLTFPVRGGINLLRKMEIPLSVAKFGAKAALAGGLIYYTGVHGLWGTPEDSFSFVNHLGDVVVDKCDQVIRLFAASDDEE